MIRGTDIYVELCNSKELIEEIMECGKEFAHTPSPLNFKSKYLIFRRAKGEPIFGFVQVMEHVPLVFPSWHPERSTPADVIAAMDMMRSFAVIRGTLSHDFAGIALTPDESKENNMFTPEIMAKAGLKNLRAKAYLVDQSEETEVT